MVQKYVVIRADDLTGEEKDVAEVVFSLEGKEYRLDLGPKSRRKLEKALEPFVDAAQASSTVRAIRSSTPRAASAGERPQGTPRPKADTMSKKVRDWARAHDISVPDRGRLPKSIIDQYDDYESKRTHVG